MPGQIPSMQMPSMQVPGMPPNAGMPGMPNAGMPGQRPPPAAPPPKQEADPAAPAKPKLPQCFLHKKPNSACKNCQRFLAAKEAAEKEEADRANAAALQVADAEAVELTNTATFNFNAQLRTDILKSQYYKVKLMPLLFFEAVVNEVLTMATHVEAMEASGVPSAFICCIYRLLTIKLTRSQIKFLLHARDSPYLRCAGVMYLRFGVDPNTLGQWLKNLMLDEEEM